MRPLHLPFEASDHFEICWRSNSIGSILREMRSLQHTIKAVIRRGEESGYVAECSEISVITQGQTLDEVTQHLREAVALHLEGEDPREFGLKDEPTLLVTMELEPDYA